MTRHSFSLCATLSSVTYAFEVSGGEVERVDGGVPMDVFTYTLPI